MFTLALFQRGPKRTARRSASIALAAAAAVLVSGWSLEAVASPHYPAWLAEYFKAPAQPPCTVCHTTLAGGNDTTAGIPYAETLEGKGLVGGMSPTDDAQKQAFFALVGANSNGDSDGDGASDKDEIILQGNPSDPSIGPGGGVIEPYEYGCVGKGSDETAPASSGTAAPTMTTAAPSASNAAPASSSLAGAGASRSPAFWLMLGAAAIILRRRASR